MASPLSMFRRHQKTLIVFFGILLMVSFGVTGSISTYLNSTGRGTSYPNEVAVKWIDGKITNNDLDRMRIAHIQAIEFLGLLGQEAAKKGAQPKDVAIMRADQRAQLGGLTVNEVLMRTRMLAKKAEEIGIVIDDESVQRYLSRLTDKEITSRPEYERILAEATRGRMNYLQLVEQLRIELLAQKMRTLGRVGLNTVPQATRFPPEFAYAFFHNPITPPSAAYDYYKRVHRKIKVELFPLYAKDYVSEVDREPTDAQLASFFDEAKDRFADPASPDAGFKQPRRIAYEFVKADFQEFVKREKKNIMEDQIRKYYDDNKDIYYLESEPEPESDKKKDDADKKNSDDKTKKSDGDDVNNKKENDKVDAGKKNPESSDLSKKDKAKAKNDSDKSAKKKSAEAEPTKNDSSKKESESKKAPSDKKDVPKEKQTKSDSSASKSGEEKTDGDKKEPAKKEPKYKPFDEVRDEIHQRLAAPAANSLMAKALKSAADEIRGHSRSYMRWEQDDSVEKPTLNARALAKKYGLIYGNTPLCDAVQIRDYELGKQSGFNFGDERNLYTSVPIKQAGQPDYLYWKTADKEGFIPKLADFRDEAIKEWKLREAAKLAREDAEKKAAEARDQKKSLKDVFGDQVDKSNEFSWLSTGGGNIAPGGGRLGISDVDNVGLAGNDFMTAVFALQKIGDVTVASNQPQDTYYVVRLTSDRVDTDFFDVTQPSGDVANIARDEHGEFYRNWITQLEKEMRVEWKRDPAS